jgi:uncharacterized protein
MIRHIVMLALVGSIPAIDLFAKEDSKPKLISTTGGKGAENAWATTAEMEKAAEAGNAVACYQLGEMLLAGDGVAVDVTRAVALLERAADAGHPKASFRLGKLFADGEVVTRDLAKAYLRYTAAAKAGEAEAQHNLGAMYASGRGVKRDYVQGLAWLIVATKNGADAESEEQLRAHLLKGRRPDMITAAEARALVITKELRKTDASDATAQSSEARNDKPKPIMTDSSADQRKTPPPPPSPTRIAPPTSGVSSLSMPILPPPPRPEFKKHVESGPEVRMISPIGRPVRWDHFSQLERAADAGQADALSDLAQVLIAGKLVPADPERAVLLLERGSAAGSPDAAYQLAEIIVAGIHHIKDDAKALALYRQAANGGSPIAMFNVGAFLTNGKGTPRDYTEALAWIVLAQKRGVERAEVERRIRAHLQKTAPDQIAVAESRAFVLDKEIAALQKKAF